MIKDEIQQAIVAAQKEKKELDLKALRFVMSQIKYDEINKQRELTDEEVISVLQKEVKKRKEANEMFRKANRQDLVTDEENQLAIIQKYLPKAITEEELSKIVTEVLSETANHSNTGKLIGLVLAKVKGNADGAVVARLVNQKLSREN